MWGKFIVYVSRRVTDFNETKYEKVEETNLNHVIHGGIPSLSLSSSQVVHDSDRALSFW